MTTGPIGSPDWVKPLPGGAKTVLSQSVNLQALGGTFISAAFDVTPFNGLIVNFSSIGNPATGITVFANFKSAGGTFALPGAGALARGDQSLNINVPVGGAQCVIELFMDPVVAGTVNLTVIGHGGGPGSNMIQAGRYVKMDPVLIAAGASHSQIMQGVAEGPGTVTYYGVGGQPGRARLWSLDNTLAQQILAEFPPFAANEGDTKQVWIPPEPVLLEITNTGAAGALFTGALTVGRP